jgi:hypothetical protein
MNSASLRPQVSPSMPAGQLGGESVHTSRCASANASVSSASAPGSLQPPSRGDRETGPAGADDGLDQYFALGTFSATLDVGSPEGVRSVPINEAIAWARQRTDRIVVRCFTGTSEIHFSAGDRQPWDSEELPSWPPAGLELRVRRLPGMEYLDRTPQDEPISWDIVATIKQGWGDPDELLTPALAQRLECDPQVRDLSCEAGPGGGFTEADLRESTIISFVGAPGGSAAFLRFRILAATVAQAEAVSERICGAAADATVDEPGIERREGPLFRWGAEVSAYPTGSSMARLNAILPSEGGPSQIGVAVRHQAGTAR